MAGITENTKLCLPFDDNMLGATTVDGAAVTFRCHG